VGTRHAVESVFDSSDKLENNPMFASEQSRMLDGAYISFYADIAHLTPLAQALQNWGNTMSNGVGPVESTAMTMLNLFDSAAISASLDQDSLVRLRFVLTLAPVAGQ